MKRYLKACEINPILWNRFINKEIFKGDKRLGIITKVTGLGKDRTLVVDNGEYKILSDWLKKDSYKIKGIEIDENAKMVLIEEIDKIESKPMELIQIEQVKINNNIESLESELEYLKVIRGELLCKFINFLNTNYFKRKIYVNQCWKCGREINSLKNNFCIYCGWYECSLCGACGCNSLYPSRMLVSYKDFLINNITAYKMKREIEKINDKILKIRLDINHIRSINYKNKIIKEKNNKIINKYNEKIRTLNNLINNSNEVL